MSYEYLEIGTSLLIGRYGSERRKYAYQESGNPLPKNKKRLNFRLSGVSGLPRVTTFHATGNPLNYGGPQKSIQKYTNEKLFTFCLEAI